MTHDPHNSPLHTLMAALTQALGDVVQAQAALARAELVQALRKIALGLALIVLALTLALAALNLLSGAAVAALIAQGLTPGLAALLVAGLLGLCALVFVLFGLRVLRLSNLTSRRRSAPAERNLCPPERRAER
jgi:uncharacterized protein (DUF697 family)